MDEELDPGCADEEITEAETEEATVEEITDETEAEAEGVLGRTEFELTEEPQLP